MRHRALLSLIVLALVLGCAARLFAGAPAEPLPPHVLGHLSLRSPIELLAAADGFIHNSTKGTRNPMPPGMVTMSAYFAVPAPFESWGSGEPAHLVFLSDGKELFDVVGIFAVDDFSAFMESLRVEWDEIENEARRGGFGRVVAIDEAKAVLVDLGDGRAAIASSIHLVRRALGPDGWKPEHLSDADIVLRFAMPEQDRSFHDRVMDLMEKDMRGMEDGLAKLGIQPRFAEGINNLVSVYLPWMAEQLDLFREGYAEIRLGEDNFLLDTGFRSEKEALMSEAAMRLSEMPPVESPFAANIPVGAVSVATVAPADAFFHDAAGRIIALCDGIYGELFPGFRERGMALNKAFFAAGPGASVSAVYMPEGRRIDVSLTAFDEVMEAYRSFAESFSLLADLVPEVFSGTGLVFSLVVDEVDADGVVYTRVRPEFADPDLLRQFFDVLAKAGGGGAGLDYETLAAFRVYLLPLDGVMTTVTGPLDDKEFLELARDIAARADEPLVESASASSLKPLLGPSQAASAFVDANGIFRIFAYSIGQQMEAVPGFPDGQAYRSALARMEDAYLPDGEVAGFSAGAERDWLVGRFVIPVPVVNAIIRNYESFAAVVEQEKAALKRQGVPDADEAMDGEEDEDDDEDAGMIMEGDEAA